MADSKTRMAIAYRAASLMYEGLEKEYFTAKRKAAKQMGIDYRYRSGDLPSNGEIRDQVQSLARLMEGDERFEVLRSMRLAALSLMRRLARFRPRLIGSVWTGHIRKDSDVDIHVFTDNASFITDILDDEGLAHETERKRVIKHGEARTFTHIHVYDDYEYELTLYPSDKAHYVFKSSITGKAIERASIRELEELLQNEKPDCNLEDELLDSEEMMNPYEMYDLLLRPLERVKQSPKYHPEGDALYHSLQVFELARRERPYDEEFIVAALLHDVGKPPTFEIGTHGRETFPNHNRVGAEMTEALLQRLRCSRQFIDCVRETVYNHMTFSEVQKMRPSTLRRLLGRPDFDCELELHRLDCLSCHRNLDNYVFLLDRLAALRDEPPIPEPLVQGRDLVERGIEPGPVIGEILRELEELQLNGELITREAALEWLGRRLTPDA